MKKTDNYPKVALRWQCPDCGRARSSQLVAGADAYIVRCETCKKSYSVDLSRCTNVDMSALCCNPV